MKILIVTDAWHPQVNGVVRSFTSTINELRKLEHEVKVISPDQFSTISCPAYPGIRLAVRCGQKIQEMIKDFCPDAIHIATEGPLGLAARRYCVKNRLPFTTTFATKFPEYIQLRFFIPTWITYRLLRWFHAPSHGVMVATETLKKELEKKKFRDIVLWTRGVDIDLFRPWDSREIEGPRPILLYVGRVAIEKNIVDFLDMNIEGTKVVVGDGPLLDELRTKYPHVKFAGVRHGKDLSRLYSSADLFVFPSKTDTFGLVILEALACGVPVAAYPVPGPLDVIGNSGVGVLRENLTEAAREALTISREKCRAYALDYSWGKVADLFIRNLHPIQNQSLCRQTT